jgi:hypothetical protein
MFEPIDLDWSRRTFPNIFEVFGTALDAQVTAFNQVVDRRPRGDEEGTIVFGAMFNDGIRKPLPHRPILNSLSALQEPGLFWVTATGWLVRLESLLDDVRAAGIPPIMFRDMLRSSGSYYDLIAELEWGTALRKLSADFTPHSRTVPDKDGNFDINWGIAGSRVLGDVKFFKNWLLKQKGEDALNSKLLLIRRDLQHHLYVRAEKRDLGEGHAIDAALEVLLLYDAAIGGQSSDDVHIEIVGTEVVAYNQRPSRLVDSVRFDRSVNIEPGKGSICLIESGFKEEDDQKTARANLLKAAKQIPVPSAHELSCVFLGSSSPTDAWDIGDLALGPWGFDRATRDSIRTGGGVLDPNPAEPDFVHLQAIIHFSIWTDYDVHDPFRVHFSKSCELFEKPGAIDAAKRGILQQAIAEFKKPVSFRVIPRLS